MSRQLKRSVSGHQQQSSSAATMRTIVTTIIALVIALLLNNVSDSTYKNLDSKTQSVAQAMQAKDSQSKVSSQPITKATVWKDNPNKCDTATHWIAKERPFKCLKKAVNHSKKPSLSPHLPPRACASELKKYNWPQDVAYRVMFQESKNNPRNLNNTPATGDYSVGCFQVNIYQNLADSRPSEDWLYNPVNNVSYAYSLWKSAGNTFTNDWPNTCAKVGC